MRIAVVVPRLGLDIVGGAERHAYGFATAATALGWDVEVWTTCARDHYTWRNELPEGESTVGGLRVRRFPVTVWEEAHFHAASAALAVGRRLEPAEEYNWLNGGPHSPQLYEHVARHSEAVDYVVGLPYATPLVQYALHACSGRAILWPCLHDEPIAYLEPTRLLFASVHGVFFNSPEEAGLCVGRLGCRLNRYAVVGEGVELAFAGEDDAALPAVAAPYLLYAGRLEGGKGVGELYEYFVRYLAERRGDLRLVVVGSGPLKPPRHEGIAYLGRVSGGAKAALLRGALALCAPSLNESFSLAMMESWLAERPVLVNAGCDVTRGHARRANGGLWYGNYDEFAGCLDWFAANPVAAGRMGAMARHYVTGNYTWARVMERIAETLRRWEAA